MWCPFRTWAITALHSFLSFAALIQIHVDFPFPPLNQWSDISVSRYLVKWKYLNDVTEIVSNSYYLDDYQLNEVDLTRFIMSNDPDKVGHWVEQDPGYLINYFFDKDDKTKNVVLNKTVLTSGRKQRETHRADRKDRETARRDAKRETRSLDCSLPLPLPRSSTLEGCNQNKICLLLQSSLMVLFRGYRSGQRVIFLKPKAFYWKKLQPKNESGVWSELQRYTRVCNFSDTW